MLQTLLAAVGTLLFALSASANVYSCKAETLCLCQDTKGCTAIDHYLRNERTEICRESKRSFEATVQRRQISLNGDNLKIALQEVRPYFNDLDWYQAHATENRGLINLSFDNESHQTGFRIQQMAQGTVNNHSWTLSGTCQVVE